MQEWYPSSYGNYSLRCFVGGGPHSLFEVPQSWPGWGEGGMLVLFFQGLAGRVLHDS